LTFTDRNLGGLASEANHKVPVGLTLKSTITIDYRVIGHALLRALRAGARGYILKGHVRRELLDTIRAVHAGQKRIPPEVAAELAEHCAEDDLTSREIDVLALCLIASAVTTSGASHR
jgi:hypothetical protein